MTLRYIEIIRSLWGAILLGAPRRVLSRVAGAEVDHRAVVVVRILGARHLVQAALSGINPSPEVIAAGVWVDTVHSVTAFGLAAADRHRASGGITDAVVAAAWALVGLHDLNSGMVPPPDHDRRRDRLAQIVLAPMPGGRRLLAKAHRARQAAQLSGSETG